MKVFYTYLWLRENGTPYYVGKGIGRRAYRKGCPLRDRILIQEHPSEQDAIVSEIFMIAYYGRLDLATGCLRNRTDGGEGLQGLIRTKQHGQKIGEALRDRPKSVKHCEKLSKSHMGVKLGPHSVIHRLRIGDSNRGKHRSIESRIRISEAAKAAHARRKAKCQNPS